MTQFRGFIAIEIQKTKEIVELFNQLKNIDINAKIVEPDNLHITLKFLGDTDEEKVDQIKDSIYDSIKDVKPFNIKLKNLGVFPNINYIKVLWIGIEHGEQLSVIAKNIDERLNKIGFKKEKRSFSPHLTIGRIKNAKNKEKLIEIIDKYQGFEFKEEKIQKIFLKKSQLTPQGPIYTDLKAIKIGEM